MIIEQQHAELVRALFKDPNEIHPTPVQLAMVHAVLGICGEAGEILDTVKKSVMYGKHLDYENLREELGDLEFYLEALRRYVGISRESTLLHNIEKLKIRYGTKYSNEAAIARADKAVDNQS